jgi:hypothetical protein
MFALSRRFGFLFLFCAYPGLFGNYVFELIRVAEHVLALVLGRILPCCPLEQAALLRWCGAWGGVGHRSRKAMGSQVK